MMNTRHLFYCMLFFLFFIISSVFVFSYPQIPIGYYGTISDYDGNPLSSVTVSVQLSGATLSTDTTNSAGGYSVNLPWDDPSTAGTEGVMSGDTISFYVYNKKVKETIVGDQGSDNELDLVYVSDTGSSSSSNSDDPDYSEVTISSVSSDDPGDKDAGDGKTLGEDDAADKETENNEGTLGGSSEQTTMDSDEQKNSGDKAEETKDSTSAGAYEKKANPLIGIGVILVVGIIGYLIFIFLKKH